MEHQRNKLRQRAKRRGQCDFPSMDDIMDAFGDGPVQGEVAQRLYSSAHDHMDCILQAEAASPASPTTRRSVRVGRAQITKACLLQTQTIISLVCVCVRLCAQREALSPGSTGPAGTRESP